jgi:hypothetical protein
MTFSKIESVFGDSDQCQAKVIRRVEPEMSPKNLHPQFLTIGRDVEASQQRPWNLWRRVTTDTLPTPAKTYPSWVVR